MLQTPHFWNDILCVYEVQCTARLTVLLTVFEKEKRRKTLNLISVYFGVNILIRSFTRNLRRYQSNVVTCQSICYLSWKRLDCYRLDVAIKGVREWLSCSHSLPTPIESFPFPPIAISGSNYTNYFKAEKYVYCVLNSKHNVKLQQKHC